MSSKDLRRLAVVLSPLIEIADTLDKYDACVNTIEHLSAKVVDLTNQIKDLDKSKKEQQSDMLVSQKAAADRINASIMEAKIESDKLRERAAVEAEGIVGDAKVRAASIVSVATGKVVVAEEQLAKVNGELKELNRLIVDKSGTLTALKEAIAKIAG